MFDFFVYSSDFAKYTLHFINIIGRLHDLFVCCNVVGETEEYHVRFCRVGARAAAVRGCVNKRKWDDARRG